MHLASLNKVGLDRQYGVVAGARLLMPPEFKQDIAAIE
jgi:hypothetical protein